MFIFCLLLLLVSQFGQTYRKYLLCVGLMELIQMKERTMKVPAEPIFNIINKMGIIRSSFNHHPSRGKSHLSAVRDERHCKQSLETVNQKMLNLELFMLIQTGKWSFYSHPLLLDTQKKIASMCQVLYSKYMQHEKCEFFREIFPQAFNLILKWMK